MLRTNSLFSEWAGRRCQLGLGFHNDSCQNKFRGVLGIWILIWKQIKIWRKRKLKVRWNTETGETSRWQQSKVKNCKFPYNLVRHLYGVTMQIFFLSLCLVLVLIHKQNGFFSLFYSHWMINFSLILKILHDFFIHFF
jgi:hypothetical protein